MIALIFSLAWAVNFASDSTAATPKSSDKAEKKAVEAAGLSKSTSAPATVDELLQHFRKIDAEMTSLSARFRQAMVFTETGMQQRVEGTVDYQKPGLLRMEYDVPDRQTIVVDGKSIWIHRKKHNQVVESNIEDWRRSDPLLNNLLDLGSYARLAENYQVSWDPKTLEAVLRPKDGKGDFHMILRLKGAELFPAETELTAGAAKIKTAFSDLRFNPKLKQNIFVFEPPAGAEIFRNFKPPFRREGK